MIQRDLEQLSQGGWVMVVVGRAKDMSIEVGGMTLEVGGMMLEAGGMMLEVGEMTLEAEVVRNGVGEMA